MPRVRIETAFLGPTTVKLFCHASQKTAGWLIKALCSWIEDDIEPTFVPRECEGLWIAMVEESKMIHARIKANRKNGSLGGRPKTQSEPKVNPTETQSAAKGKRKESEGEANVKLTEPKGNPTEQEKETERKNQRKGELKEIAPSIEGATRAREKEISSSRTDPGADFTPSYIVEDWAALKMQAHNVGLTDDQLAAWRDYYAAQGWRFKPADTTPMTRTAALASIRNWARAEKRLEIRAMRRDPSKFAPPPEKGGIDTAALGI